MIHLSCKFRFLCSELGMDCLPEQNKNNVSKAEGEMNTTQTAKRAKQSKFICTWY